MAFVLEDGSGVADANAFASVAYVNAYFVDRGITSWTGSDALKQSYIIRATDYIVTRFGRRFKGEELYPDTQALPFPRTGDPAVEGMPDTLLKATAEYANRARVAPLAPDPVVSDTGRTVTGSRRKVGPIETETQYAAEGSSIMLLKPYPAADMLMLPLLRRTAGVIRN